MQPLAGVVDFLVASVQKRLQGKGNCMQRLNGNMLFISFILWARLFRWTLVYGIGLALVGVVIYALSINLIGISPDHRAQYFGIMRAPIIVIIVMIGIQLYVFSNKIFQKTVNFRGKSWQISVTENGRPLDLPLPYKSTLALFWGLSWRAILMAQVWRIASYVVSLLLHDHGIIFPAKSVLPENVQDVDGI